MPGISASIYDAVFRRNQVFLGVVFLSAFGIEMAFDSVSNKLWDYSNKGRQWKDIKQRYMEKADDDE